MISSARREEKEKNKRSRNREESSRRKKRRRMGRRNQESEGRNSFQVHCALFLVQRKESKFKKFFYTFPQKYNIITSFPIGNVMERKKGRRRTEE